MATNKLTEVKVEQTQSYLNLVSFSKIQAQFQYCLKDAIITVDSFNLLYFEFLLIRLGSLAKKVNFQFHPTKLRPKNLFVPKFKAMEFENFIVTNPSIR